MNTFRTTLLRARARRERRVRGMKKKIRGTAERPRLAVFRSHKHFVCQVIDDRAGRTVAAASTHDEGLLESLKHGGSVEAAKKVGAKIAAVAKQKGVTQVVLDRRHYLYHGRVKAFAEAARAGGLKF